MSIFLTKEEKGVLGNNCIIPDILIKSLNLVIECFGDFWHCGKSIFKEEDIHPVFKVKVSDLIKRDEIRLGYIKSRGYDVLVIWESDWNNNKDKLKELIKYEINKKRNQ